MFTLAASLAKSADLCQNGCDWARRTNRPRAHHHPQSAPLTAGESCPDSATPHQSNVGTASDTVHGSAQGVQRSAQNEARASASHSGTTPCQLAPPFTGTVWLTDKLYPPDAATAFAGLRRRGVGGRTSFDRRANNGAGGWLDHRPWLFDVWLGNRSIEAQVNAEFSGADAESVAERYARVVGKLPARLLRDVDELWIHRGDCGFGGGNRSLLVHIDRGEQYAADGVLEECLLHESVHTSFDLDHLDTEEWKAAMTADPTAISTYARDNPDREDLAESVGPFFAVALLPESLSTDKRTAVQNAIPHRLAYLERTGLTMATLPLGTVRGQCRCGASSYASGPGPAGVARVRICHCANCDGGNMVPWCAVPRSSMNGPVEIQKASQLAANWGCRLCGSVLLRRYTAETCTDWIHLQTITHGLSTVPLRWEVGDPLPTASPACHINVEHKHHTAGFGFGDGLSVHVGDIASADPDPCAPKGWAESVCPI